MTDFDLRHWLTQIENIGELRTAKGAHWNLEIGAVAELSLERRDCPAILFDDIPDYPSGYRVLVNSLATFSRIATTLQLPPNLKGMELVQKWKEYQSKVKPTPAEYVSDGPVLENVQTGSDIDVFKFPTPWWHELDGGRYIGTGNVDITVDPEEGWVNAGTYRVMLLDKNRLSFYIAPGRHGRIQREKYFARNEPAPVAISFGHHPLILLMGSLELPYGLSEFDFVGGILGKPMEMIKGPVTGLPFPAYSEIVIEGFASPNDLEKEGPFGEWTGYYASAARVEPVIEVKAVYHRNNPILLGTPPLKPPNEHSLFQSILRSVVLEDELKGAGVPEVTGVWCHEVGGSRLLNIISIKQRYPGHARQAAMVATYSRCGAYLGRYTIVVDDDIDVTDLNDVMWAVSTRSDPARSIEIIRRSWSGPLDPAIRPEEKGFNSRAIIDACKPYESIGHFPPVVGCSPELKRKTMERWGTTLLK